MLREEEWYGRIEEVFEEIMSEESPKSMKTTNSQTQEDPFASITGNTEKMTPSYTVVRWLKASDKDRILKAARAKNHVTYRETGSLKGCSFPVGSNARKKAAKHLSSPARKKNLST